MGEIHRPGRGARGREWTVDVEEIAEDFSASLTDFDLGRGKPAAEEGGDELWIGGEQTEVVRVGGGLVEDGHAEEVGGRRGGVQGLDQVVGLGHGEDMLEGDGAEEPDDQVDDGGGVLGVLLEEGGEAGEESREKGEDVGF